MNGEAADAVVCGAGIAGLAAAYHLSALPEMRRIVVVDELPPLSLTSDKSTECYRNWWPGPGDEMVAFMNRSIDLLESLALRTGNRFALNRRGYLFASAREEAVAGLRAAAADGAARGVGPLREHPGGNADYRPSRPEGFADAPDGSDLLLDPVLITRHFPYLSPRTVAALHVRRCGWMSAQQLGMSLLEASRERGVELLRGRLTAVGARAGQVASVTVETGAGVARIATPCFVNAAGPFAAAVARQVGAELPIACEAHVKLSFEDTAGVVGRDAPLIIWQDPTPLGWTDDEAAALAEDPSMRALLEPFPPGVHGRPMGAGHSVLLYWTLDATTREPEFPLTWDPHFTEIVLRGMAAMVPGLRRYFGRVSRPFVDGGYYAKTPENRPLIGPAGIEGAYACCAFSGFGIMAAMAGGELLAAHVAGAALPAFAGALAPARYADPAYRRRLEDWPESGQL